MAGLYVGEVWIPSVSVFGVDRQSKPIEQLKYLGNEPPMVAEFQPDVLNMTISGKLYQPSGDVKDADRYAEDFSGLITRNSAYNFIYNYQDRTGWLLFSDGTTDKDANYVTIRDYSASGKFLPKSQYRTRMHSSPVIRSNPWSMVLGTDDCDNYIALPIGATYSGGDGSTITRAGEDGTITLVKATVSKDILYDIVESDYSNGELKILDELGEALEADWVRVFNIDHEFTGDIVIQNSLYRVRCDAATEYMTVYRWNTSVWTKIEDFTCGSFTGGYFTTLNPDEAVMVLSNGVIITMRRGHPPLIDTGTSDLLCVTLSPADQTTSTENYLVLATSTYICSDANFSIVQSTKNLDSGKKWIFYETVAATAEDIAHQALVDSRLIREIVTR